MPAAERAVRTSQCARRLRSRARALRVVEALGAHPPLLNRRRGLLSPCRRRSGRSAECGGHARWDGAALVGAAAA